ncbi:MAG: bifunctional nicotinamidase/pyrazinamidase [Gemmatimonadetes bacterium]|nr:MAG: bifunctional nicotinamidase/pyrazinamidase [Gemmatimonadota bacterium]
MKKALIIVDVQNDFCPGGALAVQEGDQIIPIINRLAQSGQFDRIIATQDWHPANHGSFAANHPGKTPGERIKLGGLDQILWPIHCVQGSHGADFHPELDRSHVDCIFQKGTDPQIDSYSGFYDNGRRKSTGLAEYLHGEGIQQVVVVGLATDYCVKFTALDARQEGFETVLVEDAVRGVNLNPNDVEQAIRAMKAAGVRVVSSDMWQ